MVGSSERQLHPEDPLLTGHIHVHTHVHAHHSQTCVGCAENGVEKRGVGGGGQRTVDGCLVGHNFVWSLLNG